MRKFSGAITALVTPFKKNGAVDSKALKELVEFQIAGGISGIVPCGSTGEAATLTSDEYELVVKTVVDTARKRVQIIAGAGSNDTQKAIHFSKIAQKVGADALLHVTPFYNKPTQKGLIAHFRAIADAVNLPIILYNVPGRTGSNVTGNAQLDIVKKAPSIVGVKEASGNIVQMMDIVKGAPKDFSILSGDDAMTLPLMAVGGHGCISVVSNEVPDLFSEMVQMAKKGDFAHASESHYQLLDLMNVNFIESNPIPVKTALAMMGKITESFRLPLVSITEKNREVIAKVLKRMKLI